MNDISSPGKISFIKFHSVISFHSGNWTHLAKKKSQSEAKINTILYLGYHENRGGCHIRRVYFLEGISVGIYVFRVNNSNTRTRCEISSVLLILNIFHALF